MFFINGIAQDLLPANDRATQFGDGCFTTARIINGHISLIDAHIHRLKKTCAVLLIPFTAWNTLYSEMKQIAQGYADGVIKVIISRGIGGRGYGTIDCMHPTRIISISAYPTHYARWKSKGIALALSPIRLGRNQILAGLKHLNRLEQVLIRTYLDKTDADEALVLDSEGYIIECCSANLFWRRGNYVFTPLLNQAGVKGVMRQFYLQELVNSSFHAIEVSVGIEELHDAEEVVICNALLPVVPVRSYSNYFWLQGGLYQFLSSLCEKN